MKDSRVENRIEAYETAQATILGHPDETLTCRVRNFSRSGICITVGRDIPSGRIVKVEWSDHFLVGRVERVSPGAGPFEVGLELLYCSKWNEQMTQVLAPRAESRA